MDLDFYMKCMLTIILTCIAVLFILGLMLGMVVAIQEISERLSDITSSFKRWRKSRIPDDFYHKNLDEAIELCADKCGNYNLSLNERSSYSTLCNWLLEYKKLKDKDELECRNR